MYCLYCIRNKILNYLDQVYDTNNDYKKIKELSAQASNCRGQKNRLCFYGHTITKIQIGEKGDKRASFINK